MIKDKELCFELSQKEVKSSSRRVSVEPCDDHDSNLIKEKSEARWIVKGIINQLYNNG